MINFEKALLEKSKEAKLKNGVDVVISGYVFDTPIFQSGVPVYTVVLIRREFMSGYDGVAFFQAPMTEPELEDKLDEFSENPDQWLFSTPNQSLQN